MIDYTKEFGKHTFRIFISSTFADMHAERDYLREHAFRRLSAELSKEGYGFSPVDLRGSVEETYGDAERNVFHMCLRRVDDCRPRFVGLVGDRYGWVCYNEQIEHSATQENIRLRHVVDDICGESGLQKDEIRDKSMTHIEMIYGLKQMERDECFFYFRNALPFERMGRDKSLYCEKPEKQKELKAWIKREFASLPGHCHNYGATWIGEGLPLTDLEELDRQVYQDLHDSLMAEIAALQKTDADPQEAYISSLLASSLQRTKLLDQLRDFAMTSSSDHCMLIVAKDGSGKSTLLAQLANRLQGEDAVVLPHFAALNDEFSEIITLYRRLTRELITNAGAQKLPVLTITDDEGDWREMFVTRLAEAAASKRVILIVDSIDQLHTTLANPMSFVGRLPVNTVFIASGGPDFKPPATMDIIPLVVDNNELTDEELESMLTAYAEVYGKTLESGIRARALQKVRLAGSSPLYAKLLIDYIMRMTGADYRVYAGADAHRKWMDNAIDQLPASLEGAFAQVLTRARASYGNGEVMCLVSLLSCVKGGIRTAQLKAAMAAMGIGISDITLFEIRDALSGYLRPDADADWWRLEYPVLASAVTADYGMEQIQALHSAIVEVSTELDVRDVFKAREFLYHCFMARDTRNGFMTDNIQNAVEIYLCDMKFGMQEACRREMRQIRIIMGMPGGVEWLLHRISSFRTPAYPGGILRTLLREIRIEKADVSLQQRQSIAARIRETFQIRGHFSNAPVSGARYCQEQSWYCAALITEGNLYKEAKDDTRAREAFTTAVRELTKLQNDFPGDRGIEELIMAAKSGANDTDSALAIAVKRLTDQPDDPTAHHDAGVAYMKRAEEKGKTDPHTAIADCDEAIRLQERALELSERRIFTFDTLFDRDLATTYTLRAKLKKRISDRTAFDDFEKALELMRTALRKRPEDADRAKLLMHCVLETAALLNDPDAKFALYEEGAAAFEPLDAKSILDDSLCNSFTAICSAAATLSAQMQNPEGIIIWYTRCERALKGGFEEDKKTPASLAYRSIYLTLENAYRYKGDTAKADDYKRRAQKIEDLL